MRSKCECKHCREAKRLELFADETYRSWLPIEPCFPEDHPNGLHPLPPGGAEKLTAIGKAAADKIHAAAVAERAKCIRRQPIDNPPQTTYNERGNGACTAPPPTAHERSTS